MHPTRRSLHRFSHLLKIVTCTAALAMATGQIVGILFRNVGPIQYVLRVYMIGLCAMILLVEWEWTRFIRESVVLRVWATRGLAYGFLGVIGLEENDTATDRDANRPGTKASNYYNKAVAWVMVGCGVIYFLMGLLCIQKSYQRQRQDYEARLSEAPAARERIEQERANQSV